MSASIVSAGTAAPCPVRGEEYAGIPSSRYVGTDRTSGVIWVSYESSNGTFENMCLLFDRLNRADRTPPGREPTLSELIEKEKAERFAATAGSMLEGGAAHE